MNRAKKRRKIAVVTGSRADYGLLYWIIKGINDSKELKLQLMVTGQHLSKRFGKTVKVIEKDGFTIAGRVDLPLDSDSEESIARAIGRGVEGFACQYVKHKPDVIVLLGDRFEIFAAAAAAVPFKIPIAHIHGGERTQGSYDEHFRHAITKMSHIHFCAAKEYKERIIRMGENPKFVYCVGAPGLDNIKRIKLMRDTELRYELRIPVGKKIGVVTYHSMTLEKETAAKQLTALLAAIGRHKDVFWVFTAPNADTEHRVIVDRIKRFAGKHPGSCAFYITLGTLRYLSLLRRASVMVGNSSSGIYEAPSFKLPVVNIGDRQEGRIKARNIIDVRGCRKGPIERAIKKALSAGFRRSLKGLKNPYGGSNVSGRIARKLKTISLDGTLVKKSFHGVPI